MGLLLGTRRAILCPPVGAPGWWDPLGEDLCVWAAYQAVDAASLAASLVDLSGNGNDAVIAAAPGWNAVNGWIFDGINDRLSTTFVAQNDQSQSVLIQFTNLANNGTIFGTNEGGNNDFFIQPDNGALAVTYKNGATQTGAPQLAVGNLGISFRAGYRNGVADTAAIPNYAGVPVLPAWIGARNNDGQFCAVNIQAFALYDCTLTAPQMLAVATAMAAL